MDLFHLLVFTCDFNISSVLLSHEDKLFKAGHAILN